MINQKYQIYNTIVDILNLQKSLVDNSLFKTINQNLDIKDFDNFYELLKLNENKQININFYILYQNINKLYELIINNLLLNCKSEVHQNYLTLNKIKLLLNQCKNISKQNKILIIQFIKFRNIISHTIYFKFFIFYLLKKNNSFFNKKENFQISESKYKLFLNDLSKIKYTTLLNNDILIIKKSIKDYRKDLISKKIFLETSELSLINIYHFILEQHVNKFKHTNVKKTIYLLDSFTKEDMNTFKFLHDFKHHTVHEYKNESEQFKKINLLKKLISVKSLNKNKSKEKNFQNLISNIKELLKKFIELAS